MEMKFHRYPNTYIGNVHLKVVNLERTVQFYKTVLGLAVLERSERNAVLGTNSHPLLTVEQPEDVIPKEPRKSGLYHFAILLPNRAELGKFLRHVAEIGYPLGAGDHLVSEALYLDDPDGNGIEVYHDRPSSGWTWNGGEVEMATNQIDAEGILGAAGSERWEGMPDGTIMGHIHLHVANLQETKNFYGDGLGFNLVSRFPQALFMSTGGYHHHLGLNTWNGVGAPAADENSAGLKQFTLVFPDEDSRTKAVGKINEMGAEVIDDFITKDPSGIQIHLSISK
jgi:catechol 2,3-dioxygenase